MQSNILDRLYGVITTPVATMRSLAEERPIGWAIGIMVVVYLISLIGPGQAVPEDLALDLDAASVFEYGWLLALIFTVGFLVVCHLVARAFSKEGTFAGFVSTQGFSEFPSILHLPLKLLTGTSLGFIAGILSFALGLWVLILRVIGLRETYQVGTGAAVLILLLGAVGTGLAAGIVVLLFGLASFSQGMM